jgi:15-cis-phytoene synthase
MKNFDTELLPPTRLAIAYAPRNVRERFSLLLQFDARVAEVVGKATEPLIGQMKLAWWREVIGMTTDRRPSGEPLVDRMSQITDADLEHAMLQLLAAWEVVLVEPEWGNVTLNTFVKTRGQAIFSTYAKWVGVNSELKELGSGWAMDDLEARFGSRVGATVPITLPQIPRERVLRPLTILALSVSEISGPKLLWHALTGR